MEIKKSLIFMSFIMMSFFVLSFVSSFDYWNNTQKWQLCDSQNFTELTCDNWWLSNFPNMTLSNINSTYQSYIYGVLNGTYVNSSLINISNDTLQYDFNAILNGTYVLNSSINWSGINNSNMSDFVTQEQLQSNLSDFNQTTIGMVVAYSKGINPNNNFSNNNYSNPQTSNSSSNGLIITFAILFLVTTIGGFVVVSKSKNKIKFNPPANNSQYSGDPETSRMNENEFDLAFKIQKQMIKEKEDEIVKERMKIEKEKEEIKSGKKKSKAEGGE